MAFLCRGLALALLGAGAAHTSPQSAVGVDLGLEDRWRWRTFDPESELSHLRVREIEEGFDGTLWVATDDGLAWYDGFEFHRAVGAPLAPVSSLAPLRDGRVVAQFPGSVWVVDRAGSERLPAAARVEAEGAPIEVRVRRAAATGGGALMLEFVGREHPDGGVLVGTPESLAPVPMPRGIAPRPASRIDPHRGRGSLVVTTGELIAPTSSFDGAEQRWPIPTDWLVSIAVPDPTRRGALCAVMLPWEARGLWEVDHAGTRRVDTTRELTVTALDVGPSGESLVVLRDGRFLTRHPVDETWHGPWQPTSELEDATLVRFLRSGDLLVASREGLARLRRRDAAWTDEPHESIRGGHGQVFTILTARDGTIWLGTARGLERVLPDGGREVLESLGGIALRDVTALAEDGHGRLWLGSGSASFPGALVVRDGVLEEHVMSPDGPGGVHALRTDAAGRVWLAGLPTGPHNGGLWVFDGALREVPLETVERDERKRVYALEFGPGDEIWVGTSIGLFRGDSRSARSVVELPIERGSRIWALCSDGAGGVWFGHGPSAVGLGRYTADGRLEYERPVDGSREPRVVALAPDGERRLWVASEDELLVVADGHLRQIDDRALRTHTLTVAGSRVLIGTLGRGFVTFDPGVGLETRTRLDVELDLAERGTAIASWLPRAEWGEVSSRRILTRHRLGAGPWSEWSTARSARLTGLSAGSHLLTVEALGAHGLAEPVRVSRAVTVPRPMWRRPEVIVPAGIGVVFVLASLLWSTSRWRRESRAHREAMERFRQLADNVRDVFWLVDWRTGEALYFNPAYETVVGVPVAEALANPRLWRERMHPEDREWVGADYRRAIDTVGEWDAEFRFVRPDGALAWVHARAFGIRDASGAIVRVAGIAEEITDRRTSEARQQRLSLELDHRVKNVLAQVVAIAEQSVGRAQDLPSFSRAFIGRIRSMARTHEALAANRWESVPLRRVLETALGPNAADGRCELEGPDVELSPRGSSSLGLALHELGTNATKYGALAVPSGRVTVRWWVDASRIVRLTWRELGGAEVKPPRRSGLGLSLVRGLVEHDLGGVVEVRFEATGVVCELEAPGVVTRLGRDCGAPLAAPVAAPLAAPRRPEPDGALASEPR